MYNVQFVGVVCFLRQNGSRLALLPDGRRDQPPHSARIVVDPAAVIRDTGWKARTKAHVARGIYALPECSIALQGVEEKGELVTDDHERFLPRLQVINPDFKIDPKSADLVARIPIRRGTLEAFRYPASAITPTASIISQLRIPHEGEITITVTPKFAGPERTIVLAPGTEVVIVNDSTSEDRVVPHFHIYDRLNGSGNGASVGSTPPPTSLNLRNSPSQHPFFSRPVGGDDLCPNTGCCP
jgi:hypothetical protein